MKDENEMIDAGVVIATITLRTKLHLSDPTPLGEVADMVLRDEGAELVDCEVD